MRYLLGLCLIGLCAYSGIEGAKRNDSIPDILSDPSRYAGRELTFGSDVKVAKIFAQGFAVEQLGAQMPVRLIQLKDWESLSEQLTVGDYVSLRVVFHRDGYFVLRKIHVHKGRRLKVFVSLFALVLLVAILIQERQGVSFRHA